jgi:hypothetical protein
MGMASGLESLNEKLVLVYTYVCGVEGLVRVALYAIGYMLYLH